MEILLQAVLDSDNLTGFVSKIRSDPNLRREIYLWGFKTPERRMKYQWGGWYLIALNFYTELNELIKNKLKPA